MTHDYPMAHMHPDLIDMLILHKDFTGERSQLHRESVYADVAASETKVYSPSVHE